MPESKPSWHLDDAAVIAAESPYTFYKPSAQAIAQLQPGNRVKLIFPFTSSDPKAPFSERMWVRIDRIEEDRFWGALDNDPAYITDLKAGDAVEFEVRHVIQTDIEDPVPDPTAPYRLKCFVTNRVLDDGARVGYLYRQAPEGEDDSGWRITAGDESDEYMANHRNYAYVSLGAVLSVDDSFRDLLAAEAPCAYAVKKSTGRFEAVEPPDSD